MASSLRVSRSSETRTATAKPGRERLERYLRGRLAAGNQYFKSRFIADDVGMSPSEIGALLPEVDEHCEDLSVEKWGYSSATTWRVVAEDC